MTVRVHQVDPDDRPAFDAWYAVMAATDEERWGEPLSGWSRREVHAFTSLAQASSLYRCLAAVDASGTTVGIGLCEIPQRDNRHGANLDIRVPVDHRRQGIASHLLAEAERLLLADGRTVVTSFVEVPTAKVAADPSVPFATRAGFVATQTANRRHLVLPLADDLLTRLRALVVRTTGDYRVITFTAPWPPEYLDAQCELCRRMSTDAPSGDELHEEEVWDAARIDEANRLLEAWGLVKLVAVAQHVPSGRLVAFSELVLPTDHPGEAWQWDTLVLREHRGHRLGLALKLANLDALRVASPNVAVVITNNARENQPMIVVNDLMGFTVVASGTFWQKRLPA